ncbi:MAG: hypothetical protein P8X60_07515 [Robiginitalea sp.]
MKISAVIGFSFKTPWAAQASAEFIQAGMKRFLIIKGYTFQQGGALFAFDHKAVLTFYVLNFKQKTGI